MSKCTCTCTCTCIINFDNHFLLKAEKKLINKQMNDFLQILFHFLVIVIVIVNKVININPGVQLTIRLSIMAVYTVYYNIDNRVKRDWKLRGQCDS